MKKYPIRPFLKVFLTVIILLLVLLFFILFASSKSQHDWSTSFLFLPLGLFVLPQLIYYVYSEIEIDSEGIAFCFTLFKVKRKIQWQDISETRLQNYLGKMTSLIVYNRQGEKNLVTNHYVNVQEIIDEINNRFPLVDSNKIKEKFIPFSWGKAFIIVFTLIIAWLWIKHVYQLP